MKTFQGNPQRKTGPLINPFTSSLLAAVARIGLEVLCRIDKTELEKIPSRGPLIAYFNHIGQIEVPLIFTQLMPRPVTGFAKVETWDNWFLSFIFDLWGAIPIQRGAADMAAMRKGFEALEENFILGIAPEGTRSRSHSLIRAQPGIVPLALHSGAPLIPVAHWGGEDFLPNLKRFKRTDFRIRVGESFRLDPGGERVTKTVRQQMADEMMYRLAALMPERYRGEYSELSRATSDYLKPV
jgi:1-acyl-sn-glycerol-3-phosphate acyltransferase